MRLGNTRLGYLGEIRGKEIDNNTLVDLFRNEKPVKNNPADDSISESLRQRGEYSKVIRPYGQIFYIFNTPFGKEIYKVIPLIEDDETFTWEPALRYSNMRKLATISNGNIKFKFLAYEGEEYRVKISMCYCGKEMFSHDIYNADNRACYEEMESMIENLADSLAKLNIDTKFSA